MAEKGGAVSKLVFHLYVEVFGLITCGSQCTKTQCMFRGYIPWYVGKNHQMPEGEYS